MARIREIFPSSKQSGRPHTLVDCGWSLHTVDGEVVVQLDTFGADGRQKAGGTSQTLQIDEERARQIVKIFGDAFPALRRR